MTNEKCGVKKCPYFPKNKITRLSYCETENNKNYDWGVRDFIYLAKTLEMKHKIMFWESYIVDNE
jgi:hypothetical protein